MLSSETFAINSIAAGAQTNTTTRSNPPGEARAPGIGALGGLGGLADLERMLGGGGGGGLQESSSLTQMMQNPAVMQMMQSLLSNPQYMNQVASINIVSHGLSLWG